MIELWEMETSDLPLFKKWLAAPHVAQWYEHPSAWIEEVQGQQGAYRWIHHFIAGREGEPIGFCQYYACQDSEELWEGYTAMGGSYSIDYLIGEPRFLRQGFGKQMVAELVKRIKRHADAERIVVQPDEKNLASRSLLTSCGFVLDSEKRIYVKALGSLS